MARILIVDDEVGTNVLVSKALARYGHEARTAFTGKEALRRLLQQGERYDLVLADLRMPQLDGFELLETLGQRGLLETTPVIVLSALYDGPSFRRAHALGAADFIAKPFELAELVLRVERALERPRRGARSGESERVEPGSDSRRLELIPLESGASGPPPVLGAAPRSSDVSTRPPARSATVPDPAQRPRGGAGARSTESSGAIAPVAQPTRRPHASLEERALHGQLGILGLGSVIDMLLTARATGQLRAKGSGGIEGRIVLRAGRVLGAWVTGGGTAEAYGERALAALRQWHSGRFEVWLRHSGAEPVAA